MNSENSIFVLNTLIEINNSRIEGYQTASNGTEKSDLKNMFSEFLHSSKKHKEELINEVQKLGGAPINKYKTNNSFYRIWMDLKAFLNNEEYEDILSICEYDDFVAVQNYNDALKDNHQDMSTELQKLLIVQQNIIKADHDRVKYLNDMILGYK